MSLFSGLTVAAKPPKPAAPAAQQAAPGTPGPAAAPGEVPQHHTPAPSPGASAIGGSAFSFVKPSTPAPASALGTPMHVSAAAMPSAGPPESTPGPAAPASTSTSTGHGTPGATSSPASDSIFDDINSTTLASAASHAPTSASQQAQPVLEAVNVNPVLLQQAHGGERKKTRRANAPGFLARNQPGAGAGGAGPAMLGGVPPPPPEQAVGAGTSSLTVHQVPRYNTGPAANRDVDQYAPEEDLVSIDDAATTSSIGGQQEPRSPTGRSVPAGGFEGGSAPPEVVAAAAATTLEMPTAVRMGGSTAEENSVSSAGGGGEEDTTATSGGGVMSSMFSFLRGAVGSKATTPTNVSSTPSGENLPGTSKAIDAAAASKLQTPPPPPPPPPVILASTPTGGTGGSAKMGAMPGSAFGFLRGGGAATAAAGVTASSAGGGTTTQKPALPSTPSANGHLPPSAIRERQPLSLDEEVRGVFNCAGLRDVFTKIQKAHEEEEEATLKKLLEQQKGLKESQEKVRALEAELNIAEREQIVLCEREKFAEAEEISDKIEGLKKKIADLTKKGNNRSDEFLLEHEHLLASRRNAAKQLGKATKQLLQKVFDLRGESESYFRNQKTSLEAKIQAERVRLSAEKKRIEINRDYIVRESAYLRDERAQVESAIGEQTAVYEADLKKAEEKNTELLSEIAALEETLLAKKHEQLRAFEKIADNRMKISTVKSKFGRQFERMGKTETRLEEGKKEMRADVELMKRSVGDLRADKVALKTVGERKTFEVANLQQEENKFLLLLLEVVEYLEAAEIKDEEVVEFIRKLQQEDDLDVGGRAKSPASSSSEKKSAGDKQDEDDSTSGRAPNHLDVLATANRVFAKALAKSQTKFHSASSQLVRLRENVAALEASVNELNLSVGSAAAPAQTAAGGTAATHHADIEKDRLEAEKRLAIAARNFKEAGRLTAELKVLEQKRQQQEELAAKQRAELAEKQKLLVGERGDLEKLEARCKLREADADVCEYLVKMEQLGRLLDAVDSEGGGAREDVESTTSQGGNADEEEDLALPEQVRTASRYLHPHISRECDLLRGHLEYLRDKILSVDAVLLVGQFREKDAAQSKNETQDQDDEDEDDEAALSETLSRTETVEDELVFILNHKRKSLLDDIAAMTVVAGKEGTTTTASKDEVKASLMEHTLARTASVISNSAGGRASTGRSIARTQSQRGRMRLKSRLQSKIEDNGSVGSGSKDEKPAKGASTANQDEDEDDEFLVEDLTEEFFEAGATGEFIKKKVVPEGEAPAAEAARAADPPRPETTAADADLEVQSVDGEATADTVTAPVATKVEVEQENAAPSRAPLAPLEIVTPPPAAAAAETECKAQEAPPAPPREEINDPAVLARVAELELTIDDLEAVVLPDFDSRINQFIESDKFEEAAALEDERVRVVAELEAMKKELSTLQAAPMVTTAVPTAPPPAAETVKEADQELEMPPAAKDAGGPGAVGDEKLLEGRHEAAPAIGMSPAAMSPAAMSPAARSEGFDFVDDTDLDDKEDAQDVFYCADNAHIMIMMPGTSPKACDEGGDAS